MLKKETIEAFAKLAGVSASDLEAKIKSTSEEDITLQKVNIFTDDQLTERISNEKTTSYNEGKTAGVEMEVKKVKKELGYEFEGKDLNSLLSHHSQKVKKPFEKPNEKITELTKDIEKMKNAHSLELENKSKENKSLLEKVNSLNTKSQLLNLIPQNTTLDKEDMITLFNANYQVEQEDGKTIVKQNGETIKDETTASPIPLNDVFTNWATEKKYISGTPGRGGGHEGGKGGHSGNSISGFQDQWQKDNPEKSLTSADYDNDYAEWRKENKQVVA